MISRSAYPPYETYRLKLCVLGGFVRKKKEII